MLGKKLLIAKVEGGEHPKWGRGRGQQLLLPTSRPSRQVLEHRLTTAVQSICSAQTGLLQVDIIDVRVLAFTGG